MIRAGSIFTGDRLVSMVVGVFQDSSALKPIVASLQSMGVDLERLRAVCCDEVPTELASTGVQYVWIGDVERSAAGGIMTDGGGTSVPGSSSRTPTSIDGDQMLEALSEMAVPDGRTDDYARMIEKGQLVVAYPTLGVDGKALRQLFSSNGAQTVEEF